MVSDVKVIAALAAWDRWVGEIEDHPLDAFEYAEVLRVRDELVDLLEIAGSDELWEQADEVDERFRASTIDDPGMPASVASDERWWRHRLPASDEARAYLAGDY